MNKNDKILLGLIGMLGLSLFQYANAEPSNFVPMYEDQLIVCNINAVCKIINIDDYMDRESSNSLWNQFNNELDTFNMSDIQ